MRHLKLALLSILIAVTLTACAATAPPVAEKRPHELEQNGDVRVDDYYWLRERENPEVIAYLEAENAYTEAVMKDTEQLQDELFQEIKGRIKQDDSSVPYLLDGWWYYRRYEEGKQYPIYCRKKGTLEAPEQVMLDVNRLAEGHDYYQVRGTNVTTDGRLLVYGADTAGRRFYTLRVKDLTTGALLPDSIPDVTGNTAWAEDNATFFYSKQDPVTLRSWQIWRHEVGTDAVADALVYQEDDDTYSTYVFKTKSKRYLMIVSDQTLATEVRFLPADEPRGEWTVFLPRERGHEYQLDHMGDFFYIRTNKDATNFRLMRTPVTAIAPRNWVEVVPGREQVYLGSYELFSGYLVLDEREGGLTRLRVVPWAEIEARLAEAGAAGGAGEGGALGGAAGFDLGHRIDFGEPTYSAGFGANPSFDTVELRYVYSSLTTPYSTYDYDMATRAKTLLKREEVLGGFDSADYRTEYLHATARDGTEVPISLVYRPDMRRHDEEGNPLLLYGYGSYGISMSARFRPDVISLLDRGFVFAIAHIRGGQELGRSWYENGKLLKKRNTFTDFIDCARYLVDQGWTARDHLFGMGGSAGGLLIGAVMNLAPDLFDGLVAEVPFVDVVTTMLDPDIPLTTAEYDEWGNPNDPEYYRYMLSYSPYDNVRPTAYPNLLVTTGLHDSQVQYWEPAKWVAKLRALKTDDNIVLLKTNMSAGHGGASGRYEQYRETAFAYAFLLMLASGGV